MENIRIFNPNTNKVESYYIVARNHNDKYQLVAYPWRRIDKREYDSPEDAFDDLARVIGKRGLKPNWCNFKNIIIENEDNNNEYYL